MLQNLAERWEQYARDEGKAEGKVEGRAEGKTEGVLNILIHQMEFKFGKLSKSIHEYLQHASIEQLEELSFRILTAQKIEDMFIKEEQI